MSGPRETSTRQAGGLTIQIHETRLAMGQAAGVAVASRMRSLLANQDELRMVFASAPSQVEFLAAIMSARVLSVVVPARTKADAVLAAVCGPVETRCPASILRTHGEVTLYLDRDSARLLPQTSTWERA